MNELIPHEYLTLAQQYKYITEQGKYIAMRGKNNYIIDLFLVDEVFYELWFLKPTQRVVKIEILEDQKKLDLYIDHMNKPDVKW